MALLDSLYVSTLSGHICKRALVQKFEGVILRYESHEKLGSLNLASLCLPAPRSPKYVPFPLPFYLLARYNSCEALMIVYTFCILVVVQCYETYARFESLK